MRLDKGLEAMARAYVDLQISTIGQSKTGCAIVNLEDSSLSHELVVAVRQMLRIIAGFGFSGFGRAVVNGKNVEIQVNELPSGKVSIRVTPVQSGLSDDDLFFYGDSHS